MFTESERAILRRLASLEQAINRVGKEAMAAREAAESADRTLNGRLRSLEAWRARLQGAWSAVRVAWVALGAGIGILAERLIGG